MVISTDQKYLFFNFITNSPVASNADFFNRGNKLHKKNKAHLSTSLF